ncbi:MAG: ethanolamine utilization protein EutQ [Pseudomonadota bacterium]
MGNVTSAKVIAFGDLQFTPRFEYGDQAKVTVVTGPDDGTQLGTGFARFIDAEIPWEVKYDEVILVLEGNVSIKTPSGTLEAGPLDCIWLPKNTKLTYTSKSALVFYTIHPANWAEEQS